MTAMMKFGEPLTDSQSNEILTHLDVDPDNPNGAMDIDYERLAYALAGI